MNVFIILSILIIVIGVLLLMVTPSVLFKLNWKEKTGKEKILMFIFYSILVYIINIIYWIIKWLMGRSVAKKSLSIELNEKAILKISAVFMLALLLMIRKQV